MVSNCPKINEKLERSIAQWMAESLLTQPPGFASWLTQGFAERKVFDVVFLQQLREWGAT